MAALYIMFQRILTSRAAKKTGKDCSLMQTTGGTPTIRPCLVDFHGVRHAQKFGDTDGSMDVHISMQVPLVAKQDSGFEVQVLVDAALKGRSHNLVGQLLEALFE